MSTKVRLAAALALIVSMFSVTLSASAYHDGSDQYHPIEREEFEEVWERTDRPVAETEVARTWIWGPAGFSDLIVEEYEEGDDGTREVQYFDKSRMEMPTDGDADTADDDSPWFITQGLLASELMTGRLQLGDDTFEQHQPSQRSAAGDPEDDTAPTYAAMGDLMDRDARAGEEVIVEYANRNGAVVEDEARFAGYGVTDVEGDWQDVEGIDKNIASVFWEFMNSESIIYDANQDAYVEGDLFLNAFYAVGYPLTDAFWADVTVDGEEQPVLIQCFERRCLTYTPGNPDGWEVESGNIGQHYYGWRYNQIDRDASMEGTFTVNGESSARVEVGEDITLTAEVMQFGYPLEDVEVFFWSEDDDDPDATIEIDPFSATTGADGTADVTVTGLAEGEATVHAFVDMNDDGTFQDDTDLALGSVDLLVGPTPPADFEETASDSSDVLDSGVLEDGRPYWQVEIFLTQADKDADEPLRPQDAWDAGELTSIIYERPNGVTIELEPEGTSYLWWVGTYAEGQHTVYYEVDGTWYAVTATFDADGELVALNGDPYSDA